MPDYKNKYEDKLRSFKKDFKIIYKSIITKMFGVDLTYAQHIKRIYLDLNSAVSILFRCEDITDEEVIQIINDAVEDFLSKNLNSGRTVYILYTILPSKIHRSIDPTWCLKREERVKIVKSDFLKRLLVTMQVFSEKNKGIKVVNCRDIHPALVVKTIDKTFSSGSLVVSKDDVFKCLERASIAIYDGNEWVSLSDNMFNTDNGVFLSNPSELSCYYYVIKGDIRNEYKGCPGWGKVKTKEYIEANKLKFKAGLDHPLKEFIDEHLALYNIDKMTEKAEELKIDLTVYNK